MSQNFEFRMVQWNTLCEIFADDASFPKVDSKVREWDYRRNLLLKFLKDLDADIFCLEEVHNFKEFEEKIIKNLNKKYILTNDQIEGKEISYVFGLNQEKFELVSKDFNLMPSQLDGKKEHSFTAHIIKDKETNKEFAVIITHLKSKEKNEAVRVMQVDVILNYIKEKLLGKYPFFICGDLNAEPTYDCIKMFKDFNNSVIKSTFDLEKLDFTTFKIRDKLLKRVIDYIWYCDYESKAKIEVKKTFKATPKIDENIGLPNEEFPSDHLFLCGEYKVSF